MTTKKLLLGTAATALAFGICAPAFAGEIDGSVVDASGTVALQSAEIRIVELGRVAQTARDGSFYFADVPAGEYTLEISYVGTPTVVRKITVTEEGSTAVDVAMGGDGSAEILVIGQKANLSSALSRKRAADGISDVLTRDAIGQFPDQNVAESLRRLPGVVLEHWCVRSGRPGEPTGAHRDHGRKGEALAGLCWSDGGHACCPDCAWQRA